MTTEHSLTEISPYDIARDQLTEIRRRLIEISDAYLIDRPILEKKADALERLVQSYGELEEFKNEIKNTNRDAFTRYEARRQKEETDKRRERRTQDHFERKATDRSFPEIEAPPRTPFISKPRTLGEAIAKTATGVISENVGYDISEDAVLAAAEYIQKHGPTHGNKLYEYLLGEELVEELHGEMPNKAFGIRFAYAVAKYNLLERNEQKKWALIENKQLPQRAVREMRERAVHVGSTSIAPTVTHTNGSATNGSTNGYATNGHSIDSPIAGTRVVDDGLKPLDPGLAKIDREYHPIVMATNIVFRENDNMPMGPHQIWECLDDKTINILGTMTEGEYCKELERYRDFFAFDPHGGKSGMYRPLQPLGPDPIKLVKSTGEEVEV